MAAARTVGSSPAGPAPSNSGPGFGLEHVLLAPETEEPPLSLALRTILKLYSYADSCAFPLDSSGLERRALADDLSRLVSTDPAGLVVDYVVDLRLDADSRRYLEIARLGVLSPRNELAASADRSLFDAVRRLSPVSSAVASTLMSLSAIVPASASGALGSVLPLSLTPCVLTLPVIATSIRSPRGSIPSGRR